MIDWITAIYPCVHEPLPSGSVISIDASGEVEWKTVKRLAVRGSHESALYVRSVGSDGEGRCSHLYIDGNPSKFLQGHNVVGSDDLRGLAVVVYARVLSLLNIPHHMHSYREVLDGMFRLLRVDINYMFELGSLDNVRSWLYAAEFKARTRHGRATGKGGTVYFGQHSRRWGSKAYSKYDEHMSGKKGHQMSDEFVYAGLLDWVRDKLRIELVLRSLELKKINRSLGINWTVETASNLFSDYIGRIEMSQNVLLTDEKLNKLPRHMQSTYLLWKQGSNLRDILPSRTFFRHRKELLGYGIDINFYCETPDKSNIIPLVRVLEARPVQIPQWIYEKGLIFDYNRAPCAVNC
ncbi:Replication-associated protein G2P [Salmonella enterica subsp. enterica]|nr:Replication-associated protein G2P [Salmonella enterica subsp. enterica serovar Sandiego]